MSIYTIFGILKDSSYEVVKLISERFRNDTIVIDVTCDLACAGGFSRAYIRHLFATGEVLGSRLLSIHNLRFYAKLMDELRGKTVDERRSPLKTDGVSVPGI